MAQSTKPSTRPEPLSLRELECLRLLAIGTADVGTAQQLGIRPGTVRFHMRNICRKLGATNRCNAVYNAAKQDLI